jgi:hypothetical protein
MGLIRYWNNNLVWSIQMKHTFSRILPKTGMVALPSRSFLRHNFCMQRWGFLTPRICIHLSMKPIQRFLCNCQHPHVWRVQFLSDLGGYVHFIPNKILVGGWRLVSPFCRWLQSYSFCNLQLMQYYRTWERRNNDRTRGKNRRRVLFVATTLCL